MQAAARGALDKDGWSPERLRGYMEGLLRASEVLQGEPDAGVGILRMEILDVEARLESVSGDSAEGVAGSHGDSDRVPAGAVVS